MEKKRSILYYQLTCITGHLLACVHVYVCVLSHACVGTKEGYASWELKIMKSQESRRALVRNRVGPI